MTQHTPSTSRRDALLATHQPRLTARADGHHALMNAHIAAVQRVQTTHPTTAPAPRSAPPLSPAAARPPQPPPAPPALEPAAPERVFLTDESRDNITRAPDGTSFYCVTEPNGRTHCAASTNMGALAPEQRSTLGGAEVAPIAPDGRGTGHQQVARRVGLAFDEATARVGYVEGEGYGSSLHKRDACNRDYTFRSAFNTKASPDGSRQLPAPLAQRFEAGMEEAFPPCPCEAAGDAPEDSA